MLTYHRTLQGKEYFILQVKKEMKWLAQVDLVNY